MIVLLWVVKTFDSDEEVTELANDREYGLMVGILTRDNNHAMRVSAKIDSGRVSINCVTMVCLSR